MSAFLRGVGQAQHFAGMGKAGASWAFAAQHAGHLCNPEVAQNGRHCAGGSLCISALGHHEVVIGVSSHLRQMGDCQHLAVAP